MNFDTRTILDLIKLDSDFKKVLHSIIDGEQLFSENIGQFNSDIFIESITPLLKDHINIFLKTELKNMNLYLIKNIININNIDYKILIEEVTKV